MKKRTILRVFLAAIIIIIALPPYSLFGRKLIFKLIEILYPVLPVCIIFGPMLLLFGILFCLNGKNSPNFKKAVFLMIAGTLMITYALNALFVLALD